MAVIVADEAVIVATQEGPAVMVAGEDGPMVIPVELERVPEPWEPIGAGPGCKNILGWKGKESFKNVCIVWRETWEYESDVIYYLLSFAGVECKLVSEKEFMKQHIQASQDFQYVMSNDGLGIQKDPSVLYKFVLQSLYSQAPETWPGWFSFITNLQALIAAEVISNEENWPTAKTWPHEFPAKNMILGKGFDAMLARCMPCLKPSAKSFAKSYQDMFVRYEKQKPWLWVHRSLKEVLDLLKRKMGAQPFSGGERPGAEDVVVFALLAARQLDAIPTIQQLIEECQLASWLAAMKEQAPQPA